jgi:hypothetical protein
MATNNSDILEGLINDAPNAPQPPISNTPVEKTYSADEIADVNNISVTIGKGIPTIILYAPQSSGKTMVLLRMIRYLQSRRYQIIPDRNFRDAHDSHYQRICKGLLTMAHAEYAPGGNDLISFMLARVVDNSGRVICQFLEAPGEHYFDGKEDHVYPTYINNIIGAQNNRRIWVFFTEPNWGENQPQRDAYTRNIINLYPRIHQPGMNADKVIFLFNKADMYTHLYNNKNGHSFPNINSFYEEINKYYPGIFDDYIRTGLARLLFGKYNFCAVPFSAGTFTKIADDRKAWQPSNDWYCQQLWRAIQSYL